MMRSLRIVSILFAVALFMATGLVWSDQGVSRGGLTNSLNGLNPGLLGDLLDGNGYLDLTGSFTDGQSSGTATNKSSTFAGWGTPIPSTGLPWNYRDTIISPWNFASIPTILRARVFVPIVVIGATNASPIVIQSSTPHGLTTGQVVLGSCASGNTAMNANFAVTVVDSTHFSLNGSNGNGTWTSGGFFVGGTPIAEGFASLANCPIGSDTIVRIPFNATVPGNINTYMQYAADGVTGCTQLASPTLYPTPTWPSTSYTTTAGFQSWPNFTNSGSQSCLWSRGGMCNTTNSFDSGTLSSTSSFFTTSTISSLSGPLSFSGSGNRFECRVIGSTGGSPPKTFKLTFKQHSDAGAIVATKTISNIPVQTGVWRTIRFDMPSPISNGSLSNSTDLFAELQGDGAFGCLCTAANTWPIASGYAQSQYQTANSIDVTSWSNNGSQVTPYFRISNVNWSAYSSNGPDDFKNAIQQTAMAATAPTLLIPSNLYAVESGPETWLQWDNVTANGYHVGAAEDRYYYSTTWTKGAQYTQGFQYQAAVGDAGSYTVPITVWHQGKPWQTLSPTMTVKAANAGSGTTRKDLWISDSTIVAGYALAQAKRLYDSGTGLAVTWLGTQSTTVNAADGTSETVNHEAYSGQSANWFFTNASSPFVFAGTFNFASYLSAHGYTMAAADRVWINLNLNDIFNFTTDAAANAAIITQLTAIQGMITSIHAYNSNIKVIICSGTPPYRSQDAFGQYYGSTSQIARSRFRQNWEMEQKFELAYWDNTTQVANKVYYVPYGCNWDTKNNNTTVNTVTLTAIGATNASPIVVAVSAPCGVITGDSVVCSGFGGNTAANGTFTLTSVDSTHFKLNGTTGNGAWTSGGTITVPLHANIRNSTQITREGNSVHPPATGYYQLGDQAWAVGMGIG